MVLSKTAPQSCRDARSAAMRSVRRLAIISALLGLAACNPVETWRDMTGASRNDPDPETTPNSRNLAAGEAADYPNLATVPPPPTRAMTAADREKLTQSLIADRANARYSNEQLRAGFSSTPAPPPPPPGSQPAEVAESTSAPPPASSPSPAPLTSPASLTSEPAGTAAPAKRVPAAASDPMLARLAQEPGAGRPAAGPATPAPQSGANKLDKPGQGLRKQGEPPEPGPMESTLEVPQARATPQPEQIQQPPPPPQLPPAIPVAAPSVGGGLAAGGVLAPLTPRPGAGGAAVEPPPAPPELPPVEPPSRTAAASPDKANAKPPAAVAKPVAEVKFTADSTSLTDKDRQALASVVPLYRDNPGKLRVVGYAAGAAGAVEQLNSYRTALDRAMAVAAALTKAGIPSDKIQAEAAPSGGASGEGRAEVLLEK